MIQISRRHCQLRRLRRFIGTQTLDAIDGGGEVGPVVHLMLTIRAHSRQVVDVRIAHVGGHENVRLCGIESFMAWHW